MKIKILTLLCLASSLFLAACGQSDADLQKAVEDKLKADNVAGVTVTVRDGTVTLSGEVADAAVKSKAEASAKAIEGIRGVESRLTMKPLPTPAVRSDAKRQGRRGAKEGRLRGCHDRRKKRQAGCRRIGP